MSAEHGAVGVGADAINPIFLVEKSIPPKEETIVEVELTSIQKQYYRAVLEQNRSFQNFHSSESEFLFPVSGAPETAGC